MTPLSYRSLKTEIRESDIHGRGLFARADFLKDEIVAVKGGHIVTGDQWRALAPLLGSAEIQIGDDLFIAPLTREEREGSMLYLNHSCDANLGVRGNIIFVAMRAIRAGEEVTNDWCMTDNDETATTCNCGAAKCRGTITGKDWQRPELHAQYAGYFSSYLAAKIPALSGPR